MTVGEVIALLQERLGGRTQLESQIWQELKFQHQLLERSVTMPWFLRSVKTSAISASPWSLPSDFLREATASGSFWVVTAEGTLAPVYKDDFDYLRAQTALEGTGQPEAYAVVGKKVYLFPEPDVEYSFQLDAYWADETMDTVDTENQWLLYAPDLLLARTGKRLSQSLRAPELVALFSEDEREALRRLAIDNVAREQYGNSAVVRD